MEDALDELGSEGEISESTMGYLERVFGVNEDSPAMRLRTWFPEEEEIEEEADEIEEEEDDDDDEIEEEDQDTDVTEQDQDDDEDEPPEEEVDIKPRRRRISAKKRAAVRQYLETVLKDLDRQERRLRQKEKIELEILRQRLSIPQVQELETIQRYETTIKRDLYRTIDQLERLQRRRKGEPLPPTVNVNVSNDGHD